MSTTVLSNTSSRKLRAYDDLLIGFPLYWVSTKLSYRFPQHIRYILPHYIELVLFKCDVSHGHFLGRVRLGYSRIRIYSGIYSSYSAPGSRIGGMEIQVFEKADLTELVQTSIAIHNSRTSNLEKGTLPYMAP